jgi:peptide/nickel transport system ATP-binding protein
MLRVRGLRTGFPGKGGMLSAVDRVDLDVARGEVVGIVGESGSGKSLMALSLMRLVAEPGRILGGSVTLDGEDLLLKSEREMVGIRGKRMAMIFQEPMTSLNPLLTVGHQISEPLRFHEALGRAEARRRAIELLRRVELPDASARIDQYPHQLSGGMRQRVMIAMSLACRPGLLIADEPTTALDVTVQAQILELLRGLIREMGMAVILITHDLGVVADFADHVAVMYAGRIVETAPVGRIFDAPGHPYTVGLLASMPDLLEPRRRMRTIEGTAPTLGSAAQGCRFHPRCPVMRSPCIYIDPPLFDIGDGQRAACIRHRGYKDVTG